ncbi:MAG: S1 RNA-binding domain-containing protein [Myxococcales bacterium]|nr:S1 RNA-binding domain-containing protein [Myxococcales bacterium]
MAAQQDEDFAAMFEATPKAPAARGARRVKPGQLVEGIVVEFGADSVFVDIGTKSEARIDRAQLLDKDGKLKVALGDKLRATVASANHEGVVLIVQIGKGGVDVQALELARDSGVPVEGTVSKAVKAGLEVEIGGVRAFCPASQVDLNYVQDLELYVGQKHFFKVVEIRDNGRSVIVSRKGVLKDERENQARAVRERLAVGAELDGIVQTIQPYGAFIDLGGLEGLVHISELGHGRVDKVEDVLKVGEAVRVRVLAIEQKGTSGDLKVSLSMKSAQQAEDSGPAPDTILSGKVHEVTNFGVFVDTEQGRGLVPTNELGLPHGADPKRTFTPGKEVEVVVLSRDAKNGRLRLSIKGVASAEERSNYKTFARESKKASGGGKGLGSLGDLLGNSDLGAKLPAGPAASKPAKSAAPTPRPAASEPRGDDGNRRRRV